MDNVTVQRQVTEEDIACAFQSVRFSGWPQDDAELVELFNHVLLTVGMVPIDGRPATHSVAPN